MHTRNEDTPSSSDLAPKLAKRSLKRTREELSKLPKEELHTLTTEEKKVRKREINRLQSAKSRKLSNHNKYKIIAERSIAVAELAKLQIIIDKQNAEITALRSDLAEQQDNMFEPFGFGPDLFASSLFIQKDEAEVNRLNEIINDQQRQIDSLQAENIELKTRQTSEIIFVNSESNVRTQGTVISIPGFFNKPRTDWPVNNRSTSIAPTDEAYSFDEGSSHLVEDNYDSLTKW